ncbi:MAG: hypothetical protein AAGD96_21765 [Chloroflexota bacterium]
MNLKRKLLSAAFCLSALMAGANVSLDTASASTSHPEYGHMYVSFQNNGNVGGVNYKDEDVVAYDITTQTWEMVFDGSSAGVTQEVNAFSFDDSGNLLMSFAKEVTLPGLGLVDDSDVVKFTPASLGANNTAGTWEMYVDGSDIGLDRNAEDIDALAYVDNAGGGQMGLIISTAGRADVLDAQSNQIRPFDEDIIVFRPTSLGDTTAGSFQTFIPGQDFGMDTKDEDLWAVSYNVSMIYLSTKGAFDIASPATNGAATGTGSDLIGCTNVPTTSGPACHVTLEMEGYRINIPANATIDGLYLPSN